MGEPAANPYLYITSQIVAGLDGIETKRPLPPTNDEPYAAERPMLPTNLPAALDALDKEPLFRAALGDTFIDYFVKLKRSEAGRYLLWLDEHPTSAPPHASDGKVVAPADEPSEWEQNEYFDFF
jgi:glutamine synthetase